MKMRAFIDISYSYNTKCNYILHGRELVLLRRMVMMENGEVAKQKQKVEIIKKKNGKMTSASHSHVSVLLFFCSLVVDVE